MHGRLITENETCCLAVHRAETQSMIFVLFFSYLDMCQRALTWPDLMHACLALVVKYITKRFIMEYDPYLG